MSTVEKFKNYAITSAIVGGVAVALYYVKINGYIEDFVVANVPRIASRAWIAPAATFGTTFAAGMAASYIVPLIKL